MSDSVSSDSKDRWTDGLNENPSVLAVIQFNTLSR